MDFLTARLEPLTVARRMLGFAAIACLTLLAVGLSILLQLGTRVEIDGNFHQCPHTALSTFKDFRYELLVMGFVPRDLLRADNAASNEQLAREMPLSDERFRAGVNRLRASYGGPERNLAKTQAPHDDLVIHRAPTLADFRHGQVNLAHLRTMDDTSGNPSPELVASLGRVSEVSAASAVAMAWPFTPAISICGKGSKPSMSLPRCE